MNIQTPSPNVPEDTPLVEPLTQSGATSEAVDLDTDRILRETGTLVTPGDTQVSSTLPTTQTPRVETAEYEAQTRSWNVLAVVALVLGLTLSPLAAVFGYLALGQTRRSGQNGENAAVAAIVLGWIWLLVFGVAGIVGGIIWFQL